MSSFLFKSYLHNLNILEFFDTMLEYLGINLNQSRLPQRHVCMHIKQYQQWLIDFQQDNHTLLKLFMPFWL